MTMSNEEIAREYRTAKDGLKQAKILAELNQCSKDKIVEILLQQGVKVDGRLLQKGRPHAKPKPAEAAAAPAATEKPAPKHDQVNHPDHYTRGEIECIDAIQAAVTNLPGKEAWLVGQIIKYVWRYRWKNGLEDLKKARFYLHRLIQEARP